MGYKEKMKEREKREGAGKKKEIKEGRDRWREGKIRETGKREMKGESSHWGSEQVKILL